MLSPITDTLSHTSEQVFLPSQLSSENTVFLEKISLGSEKIENSLETEVRPTLLNKFELYISIWESNVSHMTKTKHHIDGELLLREQGGSKLE